MTKEEIKAIFDKVFNGRSNPLFSVPITYFEKDNFVGEIAKAPDYSSTKLAKTHYHYVEPLMLFEILFTNCCIKGYWITVLEKVGDKYVHRTDLCKHIDTYDKDNIDNIINEILYSKSSITSSFDTKIID